jgi:hypothetical protein
MRALNEDRILDFLDGRLATGDEEELLHTLAVSPERRQLLREHLKLRELTSNVAKQKQFAVPSHVTTQLFSKLDEMGFAAPMNAEAVLTRTPQIVGVRRTAGALALLKTGLRFGATSLAVASFMSFLLGAGAYYVFGEKLGLRTMSEDHSAKVQMAHTTHGTHQTYAAHEFDVASVASIARTSPAPIVSRPSIAFPVRATASLSVMPEATEAVAEVADNAEPISYTSPRQRSYEPKLTEMRMAHGLVPINYLMFPTPLAMEKGTMSLRYAGGPTPKAGSQTWSSLTELRFGWTLWNYVVGHASMGQLTSRELVATRMEKDPHTTPRVITINTAEGSRTVNLVGLESGISLDHLGIPLEASVGFMLDGSGGSSDYSKLYKRGSLSAHFEPWSNMTVSAGIEGLLYTHYLTSAIEGQKYDRTYNYSIGTTQRSETCGFVGPTLEIGWHF